MFFRTSHFKCDISYASGHHTIIKTHYTSALVISLFMEIAGAGTAWAESDSLEADPFEPAFAAEDEILRDSNRYFLK